MDDDEVSLKLAAIMVDNLGHDPETAGNGRAALDLARRDTPDVVLMDINMPGMDGFEATRRMLAILPEAHPPHIVAFTVSSAGGNTQKEAMAAGMVGYLRKPFDEERLKALFAALYPSGRGVGQRERLRALFADDVAAARLITEMVFRALAQLLPELERAALNGDPETAASVAHRLKDRLRHVGAERLWDACAAVETAGRGGDPLQQVQGLVAQVRREWSAFDPSGVGRRA